MESSSTSSWESTKSLKLSNGLEIGREALITSSTRELVEFYWTNRKRFSGGYNRGMDNEDIEKKKNDKFPIRGYWSSDSKKFIFQKTDRTKIKDLWVINSVGKKRPTLETYKYHMAGEEAEYTHEILIFDTKSKDVKKVQIDSTKQKRASIFHVLL